MTEAHSVIAAPRAPAVIPTAEAPPKTSPGMITSLMTSCATMSGTLARVIGTIVRWIVIISALGLLYQAVALGQRYVELQQVQTQIAVERHELFKRSLIGDRAAAPSPASTPAATAGGP